MHFLSNGKLTGVSTVFAKFNIQAGVFILHLHLRKKI